MSERSILPLDFYAIKDQQWSIKFADVKQTKHAFYHANNKEKTLYILKEILKESPYSNMAMLFQGAMEANAAAQGNSTVNLRHPGAQMASLFLLNPGWVEFVKNVIQLDAQWNYADDDDDDNDVLTGP